MYKIVEAREVGFKIKQFVIEAPRIARKQKPGQFIILRLHEDGERIPLTIKSSDPEAGTMTICVQSIGKTTSLLNCLEAGDYILDIVGPLGHPSEIEKFRHGCDSCGQRGHGHGAAYGQRAEASGQSRRLHRRGAQYRDGGL